MLFALFPFSEFKRYRVPLFADFLKFLLFRLFSFVAVKYNHDELTGFLLHHGADFKLTDNNHISPLKLASISPEVSW